MTRGESVRNRIRKVIDNPSLKSIITLNPITRTKGSNSGYGQPTEAEGTNVSVNSIPSNYTKTRIGLEKMGDLKEGDLRVLIRDDQTIDTDDKVTFQSQSYLIREIKQIFFNDVVIAQAITLSKVQ